VLCIAIAVTSCLASAAEATTADDICAPDAEPCVVAQGAAVAVTDGSVLDFQGRTLVLSAGSGTKLDAGSGAMTIIAGSITLNPGSALLARGGAITVMTSGDLSVLHAGAASARIDVSDFVAPGSITIDVGGAIDMQGVVSARGSGASAGSGTIAVSALGDVTISGEIDAQGGGDDLGGDVIIEVPAGNLLISGPIDVTGGEGGTIDALAGGSITTIASAVARLDAKATGPEGDGGSVDLATINGDIEVTIPIWTQGSDGVDFGGGGGYVTIDAAEGSVALLGPIDVSGASPDGDGGDVDVTAALDLTQTGPVTGLGKSQSGVGGAIDFFAARSLTLGSINVEGPCKTCTGGDVSASAWCSLLLPGEAVVDALGDGGTVLLESGGTMDLEGTIQAGQSIDVFYRNAASPPQTMDATLTPVPRLQVVPTLIPCGGPPGINCGNGVIDLNETCDDGNKNPCDGCSAICLVERCGDGFLGCDEHGIPEACDDGNNVDCDGCRADCSRRDEVCGDGVRECGEECDTGAAIDCDSGACSATCKIEACQNGRVECSEECDDGHPTVSCNEECVLIAPPTCGNGVVELGEACDDGNTVDCDGCSHRCQLEACGNGVVECAEECDDFNTSPCDGCSSQCRTETCGNGVVDCGEECDEGAQNGQPGSTCLPEICESGSLCTLGGSSPCIPCGGPLDCDPLGRCGQVDCVAGVCEPAVLDCSIDDPCFTGTCDAETGCVSVPVEGFGSVRCRLGDLDGTVEGDGIDSKARGTLHAVLLTVQRKLDSAENALEIDAGRKTKRAFKVSRKKLLKFQKKVFKLQPKHITDPAVGASLDGKVGDAIDRLDRLRGDLGV
jgi:cysteine-rich repeat protein